MQSYSESTTSLATFLSQPATSSSEFSGSLQTQTDYWNIDDILAEEELVPTTFQIESEGLGYLTQLGTQQTNKKQKEVSGVKIATQTRVDLPVWLAILMSTRGIIEVMKPLFLTQKYYKQLKADPDVVSIHQQSPYTYEIVLKLCELYPEETASEALEVFLEAFIARFQKITLDYSQNSGITAGEQSVGNSTSADAFSTAVKRLTPLEKEIFDLHKAQKIRYQNWKRRAVNQVQFNTDLMDHETKANLKRHKYN